MMRRGGQTSGPTGHWHWSLQPNAHHGRSWCFGGSGSRTWAGPPAWMSEHEAMCACRVFCSTVCMSQAHWHHPHLSLPHSDHRAAIFTLLPCTCSVVPVVAELEDRIRKGEKVYLHWCASSSPCSLLCTHRGSAPCHQPCRG